MSAQITTLAGSTLEEMTAMIGERIALQNEALIERRKEATGTYAEKVFHEFADGLKDAATRIAAEIGAV